MSTQSIEPPWGFYRRKGLSEMRPWTFEDGGKTSLKEAGISISDEDAPEPGGMIARNPSNHNDQWYVAKKYFEENLEPVS